MADPRLTEAHIQRTVKEFLEADGWRAIRTEHALERTKEGKIRRKVGEVGMPDFMFVRYELLSRQLGNWPRACYEAACEVAWVEFKRPGKKPTPAQLAWHEAERARGALVIVVDSIERGIAWYKASGLARKVR